MDLFKIFIFFVWLLLPISWVIRDLKLYDKSTRKYQLVTKLLIVAWVVLGAFSSYFYWNQIEENRNLRTDIETLLSGNKKMLGQAKKLGVQLEEYQQEIKVKDKKIVELEKQANLIRSIEGSIEYIVEANWKKNEHPGDHTPLAWDKSHIQVYAYKGNQDDPSKLHFSLIRVKLEKISEHSLKTRLEIEANSYDDAIGQDIKVLNRFDHILVHIPYVYSNSITDRKIVFKELHLTFVINGEKKAEISRATSSKLTISKDKVPFLIISSHNPGQSLFESLFTKQM